MLLCLMALQRCALPDDDVDIIVVIYDAETDAPELRDLNLFIAAGAERWAARHNSTRRWFHVVYHCGMPRRDAGPDLARKIGMDEACRRLEQANNPQGIIACLSADSRCTPNYLRELERHFKYHPQCPACSIYFEYPSNGAEYPYEVYQSAVYHELRLRYNAHAQRYTGFPLAHYVEESDFAIRCDAYQLYGGMNRRQTGRHPHFLHKFTASPHFMELNTTCIRRQAGRFLPSATGARRTRLPAAQRRVQSAYSFRIFEDLKALFLQTEMLLHSDLDQLPLPETIVAFARKTKLQAEIDQLRLRSPEPAAFRHNFFLLFNALAIQQFIYFAKDQYYPDMPLIEACRNLLSASGWNMADIGEKDHLGILIILRQPTQNRSQNIE